MQKSTSMAILAGGESRRMRGADKAHIELGGRSIISQITDNTGSLFSEILIVTNKPEDFIHFTSFKTVSDRFPGMGPLGGIHAALISAEQRSVFVLACDMPMVNREIIKNQIDFFLENNYEIVVARINNNIEPLHSMFDTSVASRLEEYLKTKKNPSVRDFLKLCRLGYFELESTRSNIRAFTNINTPDDLINLRKNLG